MGKQAATSALLKVSALCGLTGAFLSVMAGGGSALSYSGRAGQLRPSRPESAMGRTAVDSAFGQEQVLRMTRSRPEMLRDVKPGDTVWRFCADGFGGAACGSRVLWDSENPSNASVDAEHQGPSGGSPGCIRVRSNYANTGQRQSCESLWSCALYELENIKSTPNFRSLDGKVLAGQLDRPAYLAAATRVEYDTCIRTRQLYRELWKPLMDSRRVPTHPEQWFVAIPDYETWISYFHDLNGYPWSAWGRHYDSDLAPFKKAWRPVCFK